MISKDFYAYCLRGCLCRELGLPQLQDELLKYDRLDFMKLRGLEEVNSAFSLKCLHILAWKNLCSRLVSGTTACVSLSVIQQLQQY